MATVHQPRLEDLKLLGRIADTLLAHAYAMSNLSSIEASICLFICNAGVNARVSPALIGDSLGIRKTVLANHLKGLCSKRLISLTECKPEEDKRRRFYALTAAGKKSIECFTEQAQAADEVVCHMYSRKDEIHLLGLSRRFKLAAASGNLYSLEHLRDAFNRGDVPITRNASGWRA